MMPEIWFNNWGWVGVALTNKTGHELFPAVTG